MATNSKLHLDRRFEEAEMSVNSWALGVRDLELREPMVVSFGTVTTRPSVWLKLSSTVNGKRSIGYGEGTTLPQPLFTDDSGHNIGANTSQLMHELQDGGYQRVGDAIDRIRDFRFDDGGRYPTARLAVEMAVIDGIARVLGKSVGQIIGLSPKIKAVPYGKSIGGSTKETVITQAELAIESNAKKIKAKITPSIFGEVVLALEYLRENHTGLDLMVDANGAFDPYIPSDIEKIVRLDELGLLMIEEPVSRVGEVQGLDAVRKLRDTLPRMNTPICLDDCLKTKADCETAITSGLADIINLKPGRIGSFITSLELVHFAQQHQAEVMVGGMFEATPGRCMTTILGAYCLQQGFTIPGDLSLAQDRLKTDLVDSSSQLRYNANGLIVVPTKRGWGF